MGVYGDGAAVLRNNKAATSAIMKSPESEAAEPISSYSWDQSDKFVTIYLPWENAKELGEENAVCEFEERSVPLTVTALATGKRYRFGVPNLCKAIDTAASKRTFKTDMISIK